MKIGFIGLGIMGSRMANNLAKAGYELLVYNRTKEKAKTLITKENVTWKNSPKELAEESDYLFTMLSSPSVVEQMAAGEKGFLTHLKPGSTWIDSSTVNPSFTEKMATWSKNHKIKFLDAPVAGSKVPAEKGELIFLIGGEKDDVTDCISFFEVMGRKYIHAGKNGKGTSLKMVFNLLLGQAMYAFSEGMALGESLGIDKKMLFDTLLDSPVVAPFIKLKRDKMEQNDYKAEFPLKWMQKDLHLASETAFEQSVGLPAVNVIKEIYALAKNAGYADKDFSAIYKYLSDQQ
jgi:3-hydroxyisobutyrate dehydrogenase/glyoxylate/succinic semialdehyde reductase